MGEVSTIGLDIAKSVFQVHGVDDTGAVVIRKRISRAKVLEFFGGLSPCLVGIEACPSAHHWSRRLQELGHTVRLMPPSYVKAYLKRSKNDANDAAAICEAVTRPSMRFVPTKSEQQQAGLMLHRSRQLLVRQSTMLSNAMRGHLAELGIISAKGRNGTAELLKVIASAKDDRIPPVARFCLEVLARQYLNITAEVTAIDKRIHAWHRSRPLCFPCCARTGSHREHSTCVTYWPCTSPCSMIKPDRSAAATGGRTKSAHRTGSLLTTRPCRTIPSQCVTGIRCSRSAYRSTAW